MTSVAVNDDLPPNVVEFCKQFPSSARLCRIINRWTGTLLDVRPNLELDNDEVPQVCLNEESVGVQFWVITSYGTGQAIIPVPKDGSMQVRYLTPATCYAGYLPTVSPFPCTWNILPTSNCPKVDNPAGKSYSVPKGTYEQWTSMISWPGFATDSMLTIIGADVIPNHPAQVYFPADHNKWFFWLFQYIQYNQDSGVSVLPS